MRKALFVLVVIIVILLGSLALTKPNRITHYEAVKKVMTKGLTMKLDQMDMEESVKIAVTLTTLNALDTYLRRNLLVYENTFYNRGVIVYKDYFLPVSIGFWGHPILFINEDDIEKLLDNNEVKALLFPYDS